MKPNSSVDRFVQMEYGQKNLESCTKPRSCVSLKRVTGVVPANEPPMIKSSTGEENDNELIGLWKMCMYLFLRSDVVYIGLSVCLFHLSEAKTHFLKPKKKCAFGKVLKVFFFLFSKKLHFEMWRNSTLTMDSSQRLL